MIRVWYYKIIMALLHNIYISVRGWLGDERCSKKPKHTKKHIKKDSIRDLVKIIFQKFWTLNKI